MRRVVKRNPDGSTLSYFEPVFPQASASAVEESPEDDDCGYDDHEPSYSRRDAERDTFDALTDGQYGDYDDFGGDMDSLRDALGY